jgi:hypothetical protein
LDLAARVIEEVHGAASRGESVEQSAA